jgi:hypothetical protein
MNKLLIATSAVLAITAGSAMAADLGNGLAWNTKLTTTYNVTTEEVTSGLETGLAYSFNDELGAYASLYADVKNTEFTGSEFGLTLTPSRLGFLTASAYVALDQNFENEQVFLKAVLKF